MFGNGEWHTDGPVVVGKYTQIRQRWLRAKTVKFGHGRRYKRRSLLCAKKKKKEKKERNNKKKKKKGKNHSSNHLRRITK